MRMEKWSRDINCYELSNKYSIVKANPKEFAIYESIYGDIISNRFAVKHWDLRVAISLDNPFSKNASYYWIKDDKRNIGGVLIEPNVLSRLFFIPPFTNTYEIIKYLKKLLLKWSDCNKHIYAYQIPIEQSKYFEMLGFWSDKNRRWMMRPTEIYDFRWDSSIIEKTPNYSNNKEIAELFFECFNNNIDYHHATKHDGQVLSYKDYLDEVNEYFYECKEDILIEASTLIYDKTHNKLIGACLISSLEEWPLIHTIGVNPEYRGKRLATTMIKKALTVLKNQYPVLRLFVTIGNVAESVYYELGFIPGVEFKRLYIPGNK